MAAALCALLTLTQLCLTGPAMAPSGLSWLMAPWLAVAGLGMGMIIGPLAPIVLSNVDIRHAGAASGVLSSVQQMGLAAGAAGVSSVFFAALGGGRPVDYGRAFSLSLGVEIMLLLAACAISFLLPKRGSFTGPAGH